RADPDRTGSTLPRSCRLAGGSSSVVAIHALASLMAFLRLDRERGDRPRIEPLQRDRLAGLLAVAVGAVLDPLQRCINLGNQFTLPIARPQLDRPIGFGRGTIGYVGMIDAIILQMLEGFTRLFKNFLTPS